MVLKIELRALHVLGEHFTTELQLQSCFVYFKNSIISMTTTFDTTRYRLPQYQYCIGSRTTLPIPKSLSVQVLYIKSHTICTSSYVFQIIYRLLSTINSMQILLKYLMTTYNDDNGNSDTKQSDLLQCRHNFSPHRLICIWPNSRVQKSGKHGPTVNKIVFGYSNFGSAHETHCSILDLIHFR